MKKLFLFLMTAVIFFSCNDDDKIIFSADPADVEISFEAYPGGARMHYVLPNDSDIYGICAKYKDCNGKQLCVTGSYLNNCIKLSGFIDEGTEIPVEISLVNHANNYSKSIIKTFSVLKAPGNSIFDDIKVYSHWGGFHVKYDGPEETEGFIHIGYLGKNIVTGLEDTIVIESKPIESGEHDIYFTGIEDPELTESTVIIWTEDFKGRRVKKQIFENIPIAFAELMDCREVGFEGSSLEDYEYVMTGYKYLFDGDKRGISAFKDASGRPYAFFSEIGAVPGEWIIDLKEPKNLSYLRIYEALFHDETHAVWDYFPNTEFMAPNNFKVYASADKENWDELSSFYEAPSLPEDQRWNRAMSERVFKSTEEEILSYDPCFVQLDFDVTEKKYQYIKLEVIETFSGIRGGVQTDGKGQLTLQELEIYVKKEDKK